MQLNPSECSSVGIRRRMYSFADITPRSQNPRRSSNVITNNVPSAPRRPTLHYLISGASLSIHAGYVQSLRHTMVVNLDIVLEGSKTECSFFKRFLQQYNRFVVEAWEHKA